MTTVRRSTARVFGLGSLVALIGCGELIDTPTDEDEDPDPEAVTVCDQYLEEYCAFGVDCGLLDLSFRQCEARFGDVPCLSERLAEDCRDALQDASCLEAPRGCDLVDALDHSDATARCEVFLDALCTRDADCGNDYDFCRSTAAADLPCEFAIAVEGDDEACRDALSRVDCEGGLPASCVDLFTFP